jgi:hypothetical protein
MDESSRQLLEDLHEPLPMKPGRPRRVDDKYVRHGTQSLLMFYDPLRGWRRVTASDHRTRHDWAREVRRLLEEDYPEARQITLVCDNLNTHRIASLYHAFDAPLAHQLRRRLRLVHTPKNGSWLNMAEMELSLLSRQCLGKRRLQTAAMLQNTIHAWQSSRNAQHCGTRWQFTTQDARIKLRSLYPVQDKIG